MSSTIAITAKSNASSSSSTVYGTTPGGTPRISYSRDQLLSLASSPLSRSPPNFLTLPAAISRSHKTVPKPSSNPNANAGEEANEDERSSEDEAAFTMDL